MENKTMRKMMMAALFTAACGSITTPPAGNNNGSDTGSDMGSDTGSDMGSDMGSGSGSGSGSNLGMACSSATDCSADEACDIDQHVCVEASFTIDKTGFIDDGTRWWTNKANPSLLGTITNPTGDSIEVYIGATKVATAIINGTAWSVQLPTGTIAETDTRVTLRRVSASATLEESQLFALDDKPPTATLVGSIKDERGDTIDFSTGEAVHTHAGAAIDLSGTGCPSVYTYGYLMDETPPTYGRETAPNPLAWQVTVADSTGIDSMDSAYRVRDASGAVLYDWTSIAPDAAGVYAVRLYRNKIPALGTKTGHMFVDARFRDPFGNESTKSVCFDNHPMAVPLEVRALSRGELFGWSLGADSPISNLMTISGAVVFSQEVVQHAAEPVTFQIGIPAMNIPFTLNAVDDLVPEAPVPVSLDCTSTPSNCLGGTPADPPDRASNGTLAMSNPIWSSRVIDEATGSALCYSVTSTMEPCTVPARGNAQAPHAYRYELRIYGSTALSPFQELSLSSSYGYGEYALDGLTYTGLHSKPSTTICSHIQSHPINGVIYQSCTEQTTYDEFWAADRITLQFPAMTVGLQTAVAASAHFETAANAGASVLTLPAHTWDSGNDDLPGPQ